MGLLARLLRSQDRLQAIHQHRRGGEFVFAYRVSGVADGAEILDAAVVNPADSDDDVLVATVISTGGLTHVDTTDEASIDTTGTALPYHEKGSNGDTPLLTVEQGGTYSASGETLETIIPGSQRAGGPTTSQGVSETTDSRLLEPGDGIRVQLTNVSGSTVDCSLAVAAVEVRDD